MLEQPQEQGRTSTQRKWIRAAVFAPLLAAVIPVVGVRIVDYLFPQPPPQLEETAHTVSDARLDALEAQVDMLVRLFNGRSGDAPGKRPRAPRRPRRNFVKETPGETAGAEERTVTVENTSTYLGRKAYVGQRGWDWTIYVTAEDEVLSQIDFVRYTLHPTFAKRVHYVRERGTGDKAFSLTLRGWGTFIVDVAIKFKDGAQQRKAHQLVFATGD